MKVKRLTGSEGRQALYVLAAATGETVLALAGDREELRALAEAGARRCGSEARPAVVVIKNPAAFAASTDRLSWKRLPAQILVDGTGVSPPIVEQIGKALSAVAPVVIAVAGPDDGPPGPP